MQPTLAARTGPQEAGLNAGPRAETRDTARRRTRNGAVILAALDRSRTLTEILEASSLAEDQARYALRQLIESGEVVMEGAQGVRTTRYRRREN